MQRDTPRVVAWASVGMGLLLAVLAVHLRTAMAAGGPVAVPDVPAYLGIAQWVGGDGLALRDAPFQPGYGLLIAPLVAISGVSMLGAQGEVVHELALVVNSLAAVAAVVVAARLGWVGSRRWWVAGAAGLVAVVHPSLSSASRIAWPETLLTLVVLVVALAVAIAAQHAGAAASPRAWARAGLVATLAVAVHARMVVLVVAVVGTALLCRIGRRGWAALGAGLLVGGTATAMTLTLTDAWPTERLSEAAQLDRGTEPVATVSGQLLALGGGTLGLGLIGLITGLAAAIWLARKRRDSGLNEGLSLRRPGGAFARRRRDRGLDEGLSLRRPGGAFARRRRDRGLDEGRAPAGVPAGARAGARSASPDPLTAALVCLALGAFGAVLLGGWTLTGSSRADTLLYGRYVDPWAVALTVAALAWLAARPARPRSASARFGMAAASTSAAMSQSRSQPGAPAVLWAVVATSVAACAAVVGVAGSYDDAARRIMTLSFTPAWTWLDGRLSAAAVAALVATLVGVLLAAVALRGRTTAGDDDKQGVLGSVGSVSLSASGTGTALSGGDGSAASAPPPTSDINPRDARQRTMNARDAAAGALVAAVLVLGAVATVSNHRHLADVGAVARDQVTATRTVALAVENDGLACLAHDRTSVPDYALWLYRLELPHIAHERVRLATGGTPCSELVIAHDDLALRCTNARHLIDEPAGKWALWRLPGRTCTRATV